MLWYLMLRRARASLQANDTIELYIDGDYICDCSYYELVIESGDHALLLLKSNSPVNGMFTARQEIPLGKQLSAIIVLLAGIVLLTRALS